MKQEEFYVPEDGLLPITRVDDSGNDIKKNTSGSRLEEIRYKRSGHAAESKLNKENTLLLGSGRDNNVDKLREMGLSHNIEPVLEKKATDILEQKYQQDWNTDHFYHKNDLKQMCLEFNMRLLPTRMYGGYVDSKLVSKVDELETRNKDIVFAENSSHLANKMYILAGAETFNLENDYNTEYDKSPVNNANKKVMVFYQRNDDYYELIHEWGSEYGFFRKFFAWGVSTRERHRISRVFNAAAALYLMHVLIISLFGGLYAMGIFWHLFVFSLSTFVSNWAYTGKIFGSRYRNYEKNNYTIDKLWNSSYFRNLSIIR